MYSLDVDALLPRPLIKIIYSASTWGELTPCPSCRTSYGGLARRAAYINSGKSPGLPLLVIAGPEEFAVDEPERDPAENPSVDDALISCKAFSQFDVNMGWLSPAADRWFKETIKKTPAGFYPVNKKPVIKKVNTSQGFVGIVFLPYGENKDGTPSDRQIDEIITSAGKMREQVVLMIAVSPWGFKIERDFLEKLSGVFHCLLGGGSGPAFAQTIPECYPSILWSRPEKNGMAVTEINLYELPPSAASGGSAKWLEGVTFKADLIYLGDNIIPDPLMEEILRNP